MSYALASMCIAVFPAAAALAAPPPGFTRTVLSGDYTEIIGISPLGDGRSLAYERGGIIWILAEDGSASEEPFLDIAEEVQGYRDHGLMSLAVDPDFESNGFIYVAYVVDPHHLQLFGSPDYDPAETWFYMASIGRVTRYAATPESDHSIVDPSTRTILVGESIDTGIPILHQSHGLGSLLFGTDGTLILAMGDSASYQQVDTGGQVGGGWVNQALSDGIMTSTENVGAFRAQLLDSMCGKILRFDSSTGDGLPSNPYYVESAPRAPRSRVWALGVRNGFRISVMPGSGSTNAADGDPGSIVLSDVGWSTREEMSVAAEAGTNFGWPLYEGFDTHTGYWFSNRQNPSAPNPLAGAGCPGNFLFRDLIADRRPEGPYFTNPCDPGWIEAEAADSSGLSFVTNRAGCTGDGALEFGSSNNGWIEITIESDGTAPVQVDLRYAIDREVGAMLEMSLNGDYLGVTGMRDTSCTTCWAVHAMDFTLPAGKNVFRFTAQDSDGLLLDRIELPDSVYTEIPTDIPTFTHTRPHVDWSHFSTSDSRVDDSLHGFPIATKLSSEDAPIPGPNFGGVCATGSVTITDARWPEEYRGIYFADFYYQWINVMHLDENGEIVDIKVFDSQAGKAADLSFDESTGDLLLILWDSVPVRYSPPAVKCSADLNDDGTVDGADMGLLLSAWTTDAADLNHDGTTDGADMGLLLAAWGPCVP